MDSSPSSPIGRRPCLGVYEGSLQTKRVVVVPERLRACLGEEVVMIGLPVHAIGIVPLALWEAGKLALSHAESEHDSASRERLLAETVVGKFDSRGRLFLSEALCRWAKLSPLSRLRIVGVGESAEIWSQESWEIYQASLALSHPI